jgi:SAM-dependent methyltransferase
MEPRFSFGRNWINYAKNSADENAIKTAQESLLRFFSPEQLKGKVFVDAGCGSGLFSLAALRLGAAKALSFDLDEKSLEASRYVRGKFAGELAAKWDIFQGDVLDPAFVSSDKARGDIVYSWGVLHHTGNMHLALKNALELVNPGGLFAVALYNRTPATPFWFKAKRFYNYHPLARPFMELGWGALACAVYMGRRKTLSLRRERGMNVFYDAIDWIGGYPYEYASVEEVKAYMEKLGAQLDKTVTALPALPEEGASFLARHRAAHTGCNEFLFRKNRLVPE